MLAGLAVGQATAHLLSNQDAHSKLAVMGIRALNYINCGLATRVTNRWALRVILAPLIYKAIEKVAQSTIPQFGNEDFPDVEKPNGLGLTVVNLSPNYVSKLTLFAQTTLLLIRSLFTKKERLISFSAFLLSAYSLYKPMQLYIKITSSNTLSHGPDHPAEGCSHVHVAIPFQYDRVANDDCIICADEKADAKVGTTAYHTKCLVQWYWQHSVDKLKPRAYNFDDRNCNLFITKDIKNFDPERREIGAIIWGESYKIKDGKEEPVPTKITYIDPATQPISRQRRLPPGARIARYLDPGTGQWRVVVVTNNLDTRGAFH